MPRLADGTENLSNTTAGLLVHPVAQAPKPPRRSAKSGDSLRCGRVWFPCRDRRRDTVTQPSGLAQRGFTNLTRWHCWQAASPCGRPVNPPAGAGSYRFFRRLRSAAMGCASVPTGRWACCLACRAATAWR